jgi:hypothetical protein
MPRLSQFLYGSWLKSGRIDAVKSSLNSVSAGAGYKDYDGAEHFREISLSSKSLICVDYISGSFRFARLLWRISGVNNGANPGVLVGDGVHVHFECSSSYTSRIYRSTKSLHYMESTPQEVFELKVWSPCVVRTVFYFD